jgi:hypothetical protein
MSTSPYKPVWFENERVNERLSRYRGSLTPESQLFKKHFERSENPGNFGFPFVFRSGKFGTDPPPRPIWVILFARAEICGSVDKFCGTFVVSITGAITKLAADVEGARLVPRPHC